MRLGIVERSIVSDEMSTFYPSYLELYERGLLSQRVEEARRRLEACTLCPRVCRANRLKNEIGQCNVGRWALVSSFGPHFGEERVLRGRHGSGTVFFAGCNLRCQYCQNYEISQLVDGAAVSADVKPHHNLIEMLQTQFGLTGARESCGQGLCGCCTVLVNGRAVSGCLQLAVLVDGAEVTTVEA
ncbi:MAG: 2Fe-2S iron-sulfur cluster binding domain-containing protein, partial [Candidatus Bipolaricaulota bacterium]|nr:2Fe-2S iron-sulfur cluster binding domain-containing protein [Candidatus Bipolaricaulota bacterium]